MPAKRKISTVAAASPTAEDSVVVGRSKSRRPNVPLPAHIAKPPPRRQSARGGSATAAAAATTDPNVNPDIVDGASARRASPDGHECTGTEFHLKQNAVSAPSAATTEEKALSSTGVNGHAASGEANDIITVSAPGKTKRKRAGAPHVKVEEGESNIGAAGGAKKDVINPVVATRMPGDPEVSEGLEAENEDETEVKEALSRPPPVNSEYLPLPWKGRLGYVCKQHTIADPFTELTPRLGMPQHLSSRRQTSRVQL